MLGIFRGKRTIFWEPDIIFLRVTYTVFHVCRSFDHSSIRAKFEVCEARRSIIQGTSNSFKEPSITLLQFTLPGKFVSGPGLN